MWSLIRQSIAMRKVQSASVLVGVVLGVASLFALFLLYQGVFSGIATSISRDGADLLVIPSDAESSVSDDDLLFTGAPVTMYFSSSVADQIAGIDGVERVTGQFYGQTLDASCCSSIGAVRLVGYDASIDWVIRPWATMDGGEIPSQLVEGEVIIGSNVKGFGVDDPKVLGNPVTVVAVLAPTGTDLDDCILMDIDQVRAISAATDGYGHYWEKYGDPTGLLSAVLVSVDDGDQDAVAAKIEALGGVHVIKSAEAVKEVQGQMRVVFQVMLGAGVLLAVASLAQLFARFFSMAWDRRRELALYRAVGASRRDISRLIAGEAAVLVGAGSAVGLVLGVGLYRLMLGLLTTQGGFPFIACAPLVVAGGAVIIIVIFAIAGALAVAAPLRQAGRIDPASALQQVDID